MGITQSLKGLNRTKKSEGWADSFIHSLFLSLLELDGTNMGSYGKGDDQSGDNVGILVSKCPFASW